MRFDRFFRWLTEQLSLRSSDLKLPGSARDAPFRFCSYAASNLTQAAVPRGSSEFLSVHRQIESDLAKVNKIERQLAQEGIWRS